MMEKLWNKKKSRIKIHQTRDKKDNVPLLKLSTTKIIWKCLAIVDWKTFESCNHSWNETSKKKKNFFAQISSLKYKFPVKRSEYSDNTGLFQVFKETWSFSRIKRERMERRGKDFSDDEYLIRFRTQENALTEEFGDVYVAWIDTYRRYTCTLPLHRARDVKEKFCSCIYMGRTLGQNRGIIVFVEKNYRREF